MFKNRRRRITIFIFFVFLSGFLFLPVIYLLSDQFSKTTRTNANILLVEGWLPPYAINMAFDEFNKNGYDHIFTTGLKSTPEYFNVFSNGSLIFYTHKKLPYNLQTTKHNIEIKACSSLNGENRSHFNVLINDSIVGDFFADKKKRNYAVEWNRHLSGIDSVSVQFVNDRVGDFGDRNLFVKEIIFDHKISIPYLNNSIYVIPGLNGNVRIKNKYYSYAEIARNNLIALGIDSSLIVYIPGEKAASNRTIKSALAFRDWLKTSDIEVNGINIVSLGTHAKRTWMTYNKILHEKYDIGIISLPDYKSQHSRISKVMKTLRETFGIIYYWFILIPY
ncbi:MAG: hypothetical protein LLG13_02800 [Bacteroidales bacterium]|nr:hypothetical protein [Bacteroidales bacterium]